MTTLTAAAPKGKGSIVLEDNPLGKGGEGSVFALRNMEGLGFLPPASELVAKIYHEGQGNKNKIRAMLLSPPDSPDVAWPLAALFERGQFVGFLMKKLNLDDNRPWADLAHSGDRRKTAQSFDVMYAMTAVMNFAIALNEVHKAGHMIGDINESNMFVASDATVTLVDTDSAQILDPKNKKTYPCLVGKPGFTAAEISHGKLADHKRTVQTDMFGFAVAAYQMLLGGPHPADAVFTGSDDEEPPSTLNKVRKDIFPALQPEGANREFKAPKRVAIQGVPTNIRNILLQALNSNPSQRPSFGTVINVFDETIDNLRQCTVVTQHWYDSREGMCGWCNHANIVGIDPWAPQQKAPTNGSKQRSLKNVTFGDSEHTAPPARRKPPQRAGTTNRNVTPHNRPQQPTTTPQQQFTPSPPQTPQQPAVQPTQQPEPRQPTQKELKKLLGTNKTVLISGDNYVVRPSIGTLIKQKRIKLAFSCLRDETPRFAAFWWTNKKAIPMWWSLIIGLLVAMIAVYTWWTLLPEWLNIFAAYMEWDWNWLQYVFTVNTYTAVIGVTIASLWMTISGLKEIVWYKKRYGSLENIRKENPLLTVLRYASISIVWGPILIILTIVGLIMLLVNFVSAIIRHETRGY